MRYWIQKKRDEYIVTGCTGGDPEQYVAGPYACIDDAMDEADRREQRDVRRELIGFIYVASGVGIFLSVVWTWLRFAV